MNIQSTTEIDPQTSSHEDRAVVVAFMGLGLAIVFAIFCVPMAGVILITFTTILSAIIVIPSAAIVIYKNKRNRPAWRAILVCILSWPIGVGTIYLSHKIWHRIHDAS